MSEDGELRGIIGWGEAEAMPRTLGNEAYPTWLTRDWDPANYGYKKSMDDRVQPLGAWEDSPECLARYCSTYNGFMPKYRALNGEDDANTNLCRMSLITSSLAIAGDDPSCCGWIIHKFKEETWAAAGREEILLLDLTDMFAEDRVDDETMEILDKGFYALLDREIL